MLPIIYSFFYDKYSWLELLRFYFDIFSNKFSWYNCVLQYLNIYTYTIGWIVFKKIFKLVTDKKIGFYDTKKKTLELLICGLKSNGIDYSHHICVWPSGKEKKRNVSLWTPYMRVAVICIWEEEAMKKTKLVRLGVLFWEWRADTKLRGVGASCRVVLLWKLVQAT